MKHIILFISISVASGILFTNVYTSIIDAKSWGSDIPNSISTARAYFATVNPGNFFRIFSPANQLFALLALILFWKLAPSIRYTLGAAFLLYLAADIMTFAYFYPRNDVMFTAAQLTDHNLLKKTWSEWNSMNWVRSAIILLGLIFSFISLEKVFKVGNF
jgi:hypothetical protein